MKAYKLTLAFEDLNQIIDFYKIGLKKPQLKVMDLITSMGSKGLITPNPDKTITVTWYFRTLPKYNKVVDAYLKCKILPSVYIPATTKLDYEPIE